MDRIALIAPTDPPSLKRWVSWKKNGDKYMVAQDFRHGPRGLRHFSAASWEGWTSFPAKCK
jgi:hypothetical protein